MVGLDAVSWPAVEELLAAGQLPALAGLVERGGRGGIRLPQGLSDVAVWLSFATGLPPDEHGWCYPLHLDGGGYEPQSVGRERIRARPFWQDVSDTGHRVVVVDVPWAPLGHGLDGVALADWLTHDERGVSPFSDPPGLAETVVARYGPGHTRACVDLPATMADRHRFLDEQASMTTRKGDLAVDLLAAHRPDLAVIVFNAGHCVGHSCWRLHDTGHPRHDPEARQQLGDPITDHYRALDRELGRIVAAAGSDATVIAFAGQGIGSAGFDQPWLDEVLYRLDRRLQPAATIHQRARSAWRAVVPRRLREAMPARWHRFTRRQGYQARAGRSFFSMNSDSTCGLVRVNLIGRERDGVVPPDQLDATLTHLEVELLALVDDVTGEAVITHVERLHDRWTGPHADLLPDLLVVARDQPLGAVRSPTIGVLPGPVPHTLCHHTQSGWFAAAGPLIEGRGDLGEVDIAELGGFAAAHLGAGQFTAPRTRRRSESPVLRRR